ncbi:MAG: hypothetical protein CSB48_00265 [Proteobacteria bacterium]|nr:MAG: hypothetical protein CSB48_00265 [Pseudomonadota bacterium]
MKYEIVPVTSFMQNCSVIWCEDTLKAAVVDPGGDLDKIHRVIRHHGLGVDKILLTHGHIDHAGGTAELAGELNVPIVGPHKEDQFLIDGLPQQSRMFGFPDVGLFSPDRWLEEGETVDLGSITLTVLHCPGHTPGHIVFFEPVSQLAIVGDVLFQGSIGRTDFPRGDYATLIASIKNKLLPLGDRVAFIPGHGPMSTIGQERKTNPFIAG